MASGTVAAVYAQAVLDLADERGKRPDVVEDCRELARVFRENPQALAGLDDPRVGKDKAKAVLRQAFGSSISREIVDLVNLMIDRNRLRDIPAVIAEAVRLAEKAAGVVHVLATTAVPLSTTGQARLMDGLKRVLGQGVVLKTEIDPALIGGLTVRVEDMYIDGSVRRQLDAVKTKILEAPLIGGRLWEGEFSS
jgi:F-type H+-transporting ATPase subunit delta